MGYIVNAFQIPNDLVDRLLPQLSPNALKCFLVIVRKTIGWGKEFDAISASQFAALTGIRKSDTIWTAIRELKELKLIEDVSIPGRPTQFKVVTQTHPENGDTPNNGSPRSGGASPTPKKGTTLKRGTQNPTFTKSKKKEEDEEEVVCEEEIIAQSVLAHVPGDEIAAAIDYVVSKYAKRSPAGYRAKLMAGLAATEPGWIATVEEGIRSLRAKSNTPSAKIHRRVVGEVIGEVGARIKLMQQSGASSEEISLEVSSILRNAALSGRISAADSSNILRDLQYTAGGAA